MISVWNLSNHKEEFAKVTHSRLISSCYGWKCHRKYIQAENDNIWKSIRTLGKGPRISHLFYADDLLIYIEATERHSSVIESIVGEFCKSFEQILAFKNLKY